MASRATSKRTTSKTTAKRRRPGAKVDPIVAMVATADRALRAIDPIFAAIDAWRRADAACVEVDGDIPDDVADRCDDAYDVVLRTRPITPAGLAALTGWVRERADWLLANGTELSGKDLCALTAAIDDATRGVIGLEPWSPPLPAASTLTGFSIREATDLYNAYWAAAELLQGSYNMPRVKGALADVIETEIEVLTTKACNLAEEINGLEPSTQDEADAKLEMMVDHLGKRCGDYGQAALLASQLLPLLSGNSPLPRR